MFITKFVHMTTVIASEMLPIAVYGVILLFCVVKGEEPHCSKFDFEEKMLEKMVRMEFEMGRIKVEMQNNVKTVQNMNAQFEKNVDTFSKKEVNIDERLGQLETFKDKLSEDIKDTLQTELSNFKESQRKPTVAFTATAKSDAFINVQREKAFVLPVVILNEGSGYDSTTGVFTAPVNGTYFFTAAFCVIPDKYFIFSILVDENKQSATLIRGDENYSCHSADAIAVLTPGQKVWVQVLASSSTGEISEC